MSAKKIVQKTLIVLTVIYVLLCVVSLLIEVENWSNVLWSAVGLYIIGVPAAIWLLYFAVQGIISGFKERKLKTIVVTSVVGVLLAIGLQFLASYENAKLGFGEGPYLECSQCDALIHNVNGVYFPGHFFYIKLDCSLRDGNPDCQHIWSEQGSGHADGSIYPLYGPLLDLSHYLFWCSFTLIGIFGLYILRIQRKKPRENRETTQEKT